MRPVQSLCCAKSSGDGLAEGCCARQMGRGCSVVPLLLGDIHEKGSACLCLTFPLGKVQFNYLIQRGTESPQLETTNLASRFLGECCVCHVPAPRPAQHPAMVPPHMMLGGKPSLSQSSALVFPTPLLKSIRLCQEATRLCAHFNQQ